MSELYAPEKSDSTIEVSFKNLPLHVNDIYYPLLFNKDRYLILYGGAGSGKSVFAAQKMIYRCVSEPGHRMLVVRKVAATLRNSVWKSYQDNIAALGLSKLFTSNKTEFTIKCANGNEIIFVGLDDEEKIKSIAGITSVHIEEATDLKVTQDTNDFEQLDLRVRGHSKNYKQFILTFNPVSETHWIRKRFFMPEKFTTCGPQNRYVRYNTEVFVKDKKYFLPLTYVKTTYEDNRFLDDLYVAKLESLRWSNPHYYSIYCQGNWGSLKGLIYSPPKVIKNVAEIQPVEKFYGLDFGYNHPCALIECNINKKVSSFRTPSGLKIALREIIYESKLTTTELCKKMESLGVDKKAPIYCDSAEPDRIAELRVRGFNAKPAHKGKNSIKDGINFVKDSEIQLFITANSDNLQKEFDSYSWAVDSDGEPLDIPVDFNDHGMDAMRYGIYTHVGRRANAGYFGGGQEVY